MNGCQGDKKDMLHGINLRQTHRRNPMVVGMRVANMKLDGDTQRRASVFLVCQNDGADCLSH